ncbi:MAG: hypothetical protein ASARMPREDX12_002883 [Alectoria sarmentosa]|nr:MAG: hypothetical protein ASARMPREDX12_002883 [Alectoria sarmentosa]
MAEHTDKILYVRADTYSGWHTQLPNDSILESTIGQISYSQSHHLPGHKYHSQQQDAVACSVSNNLNLPMPMHFRYPMRWPQNLWSESFDILSNDSARGGFGSDLEPTELKTRFFSRNRILVLQSSNINMPACATHSSPELTSSMAKIEVDSFSELQTGFDSSSFDFAMAFTEASYPAQTSADTTSPALRADLRATTQPNISPNAHRGPFPPDLFAPLKIYSLNPPPSDEARRQSLRFPTDLYTPAYIRNYGIEREGWCGICRPGRWLVLKNSAFWYDKSFMHGISAASGTRFEEPVAQKTTGQQGRNGFEDDDL